MTYFIPLFRTHGNLGYLPKFTPFLPFRYHQVRHECAEAIGSVATPEAIKVLESYVQDPVRVVRESCQVALDMAEHEASGELQYADTLAKIKAAVA